MSEERKTRAYFIAKIGGIRNELRSSIKSLIKEHHGKHTNIPNKDASNVIDFEYGTLKKENRISSIFVGQNDIIINSIDANTIQLQDVYDVGDLMLLHYMACEINSEGQREKDIDTAMSIIRREFGTKRETQIRKMLDL